MNLDQIQSEVVLLHELLKEDINQMLKKLN